MANPIWLIVVTAVVTSAITLGAAWLIFQRYLRSRITAAVDEKTAQLAAVLEARVREGVRQGLRDGVADLPADVLRNTGRGLTKTGVGLIGDSINSILGTPGKRRDS